MPVKVHSVSHFDCNIPRLIMLCDETLFLSFHKYVPHFVNYLEINQEYYGPQCLKITEKVSLFCERSELRLHFEWTKVD